MEFPGVLKKDHVEIPGVKQKRSAISRGGQEKFMWNFNGSWFLAFEFPRGLAQFCKISRGKALVSPEFPRVK